ncbi:hypothetical protein CDIOL_09710 [Clostridium diolis]|uniref:Uncharacterized protein n=1 Tax=Clostridium diolis TaxID=223919 RepID=A0AAV3VVT4_9CLOT|nr:hypothetical protein CDIOL_09710 [Clostridium diolis]
MNNVNFIKNITSLITKYNLWENYCKIFCFFVSNLNTKYNIRKNYDIMVNSDVIKFN